MRGTLAIAAGIAGLVATSALAAAAPEEPDGPEVLLRQVRENRHRLMASQIEAPPPSAPTVDLGEATQRLREAVRRPIVRRERPEPAAPAGVVPRQGTDGEQPPAAEPPPDRPAPAEKQPPLSAEEMERIREMPLDRLSDALGLADALFLGDHLPEATVLYERLIGQKSVTDHVRAWALFQAANCKRRTDPAGAGALYDRLLTEFPDAPWAEAAKVRKTLLKWQTTTQPQALLVPVETLAQDPGTAETGP